MNSTADRHVGELQRRVVSVNGIRTSGPNGITAKARNAGTVDDARAPG